MWQWLTLQHQADHISQGFIYDGFSARGYSGSLFHLNWIVFNATVFLCIWTQSELGFSSEGAAAAMMANLLKSATKWSRSPLIPDTGRRTQICNVAQMSTLQGLQHVSDITVCSKH